jgi:ribonucleoside-diphosphate reductase beta chain
LRRENRSLRKYVDRIRKRVDKIAENKNREDTKHVYDHNQQINFKDRSDKKYTLYPIDYPNLFDLYKMAKRSIWDADDINYSEDYQDWTEKLTGDERKFLQYILAFFASSDNIVNENLVANFFQEVNIPEAQAFYGVQIFMEVVHSETYSLFIENLIDDMQIKNDLFNSISTLPCVAKKAQWCLKWIDEGSTFIECLDESIRRKLVVLENKYMNIDSDLADTLHVFTRNRPIFAQRLVAFVCVEGIFFSGSFAAIYWVKSRSLMHALSLANEYIARDESLHATFAVELYKTLCLQDQSNFLDQTIVHEIFSSACEVELNFFSEALPTKLEGMSELLMHQHIRYTTDYWLDQLGYNKLYNVECPFEFMKQISAQSKENFFEQRATNYQISGVNYYSSDFKNDSDW